MNTETSEISGLGRRKQKAKIYKKKKPTKNLKKKILATGTLLRTLAQLISFWYSPCFLKLQQNFKSNVMFLSPSFRVGDVQKVRTELDGVHYMKLI